MEEAPPSIAFRGSPGPSLGIEVELSVVDQETRALTSAATSAIAALTDTDADGQHPRAKHELFESTVEVITGVCSTVAEARADLQTTMRELAAVLEARGEALCCSGTHPFTHWADLEVSPNPRYHALVERLQWTARRMAIFGIHYHVGVPTGEHAVAIVNTLAFHLPVFLALSTSSPYWHGRDTGMQSCRTKVFESLPTAGLPPHLDDWADFERFMATLLTADAISTIREVWWDVRPHPDFGTVELRMCDGMPTLADVAAVGALAQCLVAELTERIDAGETPPTAREWVLRQNKWLAARHGLDALLIVDDRGGRMPAAELVAGLAARLRPTAQRLGCVSELDDIARITQHGPSSVRQRALVADGATMPDLVDHLVAQLRADLERAPASP